MGSSDSRLLVNIRVQHVAFAVASLCYFLVEVEIRNLSLMMTIRIGWNGLLLLLSIIF